MLTVVKKHAKTKTKLFFPCPVLLDYSIFIQIFCPGLQVPNFTLNWQVCFFGPNLPKKSVSGLKQKNIRISLGTKFQLNDTHIEEQVLYWIQYKNSLKYKVGSFRRFSYVYTINKVLLIGICNSQVPKPSYVLSPS